MKTSEKEIALESAFAAIQICAQENMAVSAWFPISEDQAIRYLHFCDQFELKIGKEDPIYVSSASRNWPFKFRSSKDLD